MRASTAAVLLPALLLAGEHAGPSGPLVINERWPRATDLRSWTEDIMRIEGLTTASETAQGKAFFEWLRLYCRMAVGGMIQAHEGPYAKERYVLDAHKNLFVYGWGYCDTCSRIADAAWKEYKQDPAASDRVVVRNEGAGYHTKYRLRLDGNHGAFDPRYGYYLIDRDTPDARVLDWAEVGDDANILRNKKFRHRSRPFFEYFGAEWKKTLRLRPLYFANQKDWEQAGAPLESVFGDSHYRIGTRFHDMNFRLPKGTTITRYWDNSARAFYRPISERANRELPFLPSGRFYRVTESMLGGNWPKYDPNYERAKPYLVTIPRGEGYDPEMEGGRSIGQAWGRLEYRPDLRDPELVHALAPGSTLVPSRTAPYLRPAEPDRGGSGVFDIYSPYVIVEGELTTDAAGPVRMEMRVLHAKAANASEPDVWSEWQELDIAGRVALGRSRFNGKDVSVHGVYRLQLRATVPPSGKQPTAGLNMLSLSLIFENGIMSLPRLFEGRNNMRFELRNGSRITAPVLLTYRYTTADGERTLTRALGKADVVNDSARFILHAPGLIRCNSVSVEYR